MTSAPLTAEALLPPEAAPEPACELEELEELDPWPGLAPLSAEAAPPPPAALAAPPFDPPGAWVEAERERGAESVRLWIKRRAPITAAAAIGMLRYLHASLSGSESHRGIRERAGLAAPAPSA